MKYSIIGKNIMSRRERRQNVIKWLLYALCLVAFYTVMRCGIFGFAQPVLIIPLAVAAAMLEGELPSCIFAVFCGFYIDISCGYLFGFSALWLLMICLTVSLLCRNLIRTNIINFLWITLAAAALELSMAYLFHVVIWDYKSYEIIFSESVLPTGISTFIISPFVYLLVRALHQRFGGSAELNRYEPTEADEENNSATEKP